MKRDESNMFLAERATGPTFQVGRVALRFGGRSQRGRPHLSTHFRSASVLPDLVIAIMLLGLVLLPLAHSFASQRRLLQAEMDRATMVQLVDGELEILLAGPWRKLPEGTSSLTIRTNGLVRVAAGSCAVTRSNGMVKLEWTPAARSGVGRIIREGGAR